MLALVTRLVERACARLGLQGPIALVRRRDTSWFKCKCIVCCSVGGLTLRVFRNDVRSLEPMSALHLDCDREVA